MKKKRKNKRSTPLPQKNLSFDIVIAVHNALEEVKKCFESIYQNTGSLFRLIIINDGSDFLTSSFLNDFARVHSNILLIDNPAARGYTKAANQGLREVKADFAVLMNSDVVVPESWLQRLAEPAVKDKSVGLVGPLSNAASWQSVPERFDDNGGLPDRLSGWKINDLPEGMNVNDFDKLVNSVSNRIFPKVPLLNGFCTLIRKNVFEKIGYLDEESFPFGYGEENDFCLRTAKAGFKLVVNDSVYIFHAKSKSFGHKKRLELSNEGGKQLLKKYGNDIIDSAVQSLKDNIHLKDIREKIEAALKGKDQLGNSLRRNALLTVQEKDKLKVLFILPIAGVAGGIHSIVQEVSGMHELGVDAKIATWQHFQPVYFTVYSELENKNELFYFFSSYEELVSYSSRYDVVVATIHSSILLLKKISDSNPHILPAYYIQDYEPFFFEKDSEDWKIAYDSYTLIPDALLFAKTKWLCDVIGEIHKVNVQKVSPSLDQKVYYPAIVKNDDCKEIKITAMVRPSTPRRGAERTMRVLKRIKEKYGSRVKIIIFGTSNEQLKMFNISSGFEFENPGVLNREQVASLLKKSDIFLDFSVYQAFGRTGLEAMASGCAAVLPVKGGTSEYAVHMENSMLVDTSSDENCFNAVDLLVEDKELREKIKFNGILKSAEYSIRKAALSEILLFRKYLTNKRGVETHGNASVHKYNVDEFLKEDKGIRYDLASILLFLNSSSKYSEEYLYKLENSVRTFDKILVVDLGIAEEEKKKFKSYAENKNNFEWINAESKSYSEAIFICLEKTSNPYIATLTYGFEFSSNWLQKLLYYFSNSTVACAAPLVYSNNSGFIGFNDQLSGDLSVLLKLYRNLDQLNKELEKNFDKTGHSVKLNGSQCTLYRKVLLNKLGNPGSLSQKLFELYVSWRFRAVGYSIITALDCCVKAHPDFKNLEPGAEKDQLLSMLHFIENIYGKNNLPTSEEIWGIKLPEDNEITFNENTKIGDVEPSNFKELKNSAGKLVSIIIVTYNQLDYTKKCIESIKEHTNSPYELIVVDNGSGSDTIEYLKTIQSENNTRIIFNNENTGFPKAVNIGIKHALGDFILLLNNDTVVTKNWLSYLIEKINKDEKIGIAGPVSNEVSGVQKIVVNYKGIDDMHLFAAERNKNFRNKYFEFPRTAFLCTLIKKEVIETIGGLDERFSPGNFEDDDFCLRAQLAGYKTVIAEDVFIHHYGSKSFKAAGIEKYAEKLSINKQKFIDKWGADPEEIWLKGKSFRKREIKFPIDKDVFKESFERVQIHVRENEYSLAASEVLRAIDNYPENNGTKLPDLLSLAGNIFMMINDYERAHKFFEDALKLDPASSHACTGLGELFFASEMYKESKIMFDWGVKNNPSNRAALEGLAKVNQLLGSETSNFSAESTAG